jgi:Tail tubular protein
MQKLDVINAMLASMGQASLNSLTEANSFKDTGLNNLDLCQRRILSRGFWFNVEERQLTPDLAGEITVPNDTIELRNIGQNKYVRRGRKVYDQRRRSYLFESSIKVEVTFDIDFDDLPTLAQDYISAVALYEFQLKYDADETKTRRLNQRKTEAWAALNSEDITQRREVIGFAHPAYARMRSRGPIFQ